MELELGLSITGVSGWGSLSIDSGANELTDTEIIPNIFVDTQVTPNELTDTQV